MLYDLHELQRAFLNPLSRFTDSSSLLFTHPYSPLAYTPVSRQMAATYELVHRLGKDYEKPKWHLDQTTIEGRETAVAVNTVVQKPFCNLIHFNRALPAGRASDPRVLLVAPLSGHHATLLRDTVRS